MTIQSIPKLLKPNALSSESQDIIGLIPLATFKRLCEHLVEPQGDVEVKFSFSRLTKKQIIVHLELKATLLLICQRCLEPYNELIVASSTLCPIQEEADAEALPDEYEPVLLEQGNLNLYSMIEDELLLSLPIIASHPLDECPAKASVAQEGVHEKNNSNNPGQFAILANLKKNPRV